MKKLLQWIFQKKETQIQIVRRDPLRITFDQWRADKNLTEAANRALREPTVRHMLDTLYHNQTGRWAMNPSLPLDERAIRSAINEGYAMCLTDFELLGVRKEPEMPVDATYREDNVQHE